MKKRRRRKSENGKYENAKSGTLYFTIHDTDIVFPL
jgi:hypothetical protein